jgi:hypothetical protein
VGAQLFENLKLPMTAPVLCLVIVVKIRPHVCPARLANCWCSPVAQAVSPAFFKLRASF